MNLVILMGRLAREVELKETGSGLQVANFTIALDGFKKDDDPEFVRCTAFGKTAEIIEQYIKQGDGIHVQGRLKTDSWEKDGDRKSMTKVIVNSFEFPPGKSGKSSGSKPEPKKKAKKTDFSKPEELDDSEIPF